MSLNNVLEGLKIFAKHDGYINTGHYEIYAGQGSGVKLTVKEVLTLFNNQWSLECDGCADSKKKKSDVFYDPDMEDHDDPAPRHLYTCNEWKIFV